MYLILLSENITSPFLIFRLYDNNYNLKKQLIKIGLKVIYAQLRKVYVKIVIFYKH